MSGEELAAALNGPPPRELEPWARNPYVSDTQHEFWRVHQVYARPFWVLQGEQGGHQVAHTAWQQNVLQAKGLPIHPPAVGSLPPCPFDNRVKDQLVRLNRLRQMEGDLGRLLASGSAEAAVLEREKLERELREIQMASLESQYAETVELTMSLTRGHNPKTHLADDLLVPMHGTAQRASEALDKWLETGDDSL